jgi:hypothetical protein
MPPLTGLFHFVFFPTMMSHLRRLFFAPVFGWHISRFYSSVAIALSEAQPFPNAAMLE